MFNFKAVLAVMVAAVIAIGAGCGDDDDDGGGGGGDGGGTQEVIYNLPTPPSALFYPTLVAEELGFFEEEGVSPEPGPGRRGDLRHRVPRQRRRGRLVRRRGRDHPRPLEGR